MMSKSYRHSQLSHPEWQHCPALSSIKIALSAKRPKILAHSASEGMLAGDVEVEDMDGGEDTSTEAKDVQNAVDCSILRVIVGRRKAWMWQMRSAERSKEERRDRGMVDDAAGEMEKRNAWPSPGALGYPYVSKWYRCQ